MSFADKYAAINWDKVDSEIKSEIDIIKSQTQDFSDAEKVKIFKDNADDLFGMIEENFPESIAVDEPAQPKKKAGRPKGTTKNASDSKPKTETKTEPKPKAKPKAKAPKAKIAKKEKEPSKSKAKSNAANKTDDTPDCDELLKKYLDRKQKNKEERNKKKAADIAVAMSHLISYANRTMRDIVSYNEGSDELKSMLKQVEENIINLWDSHKDIYKGKYDLGFYKNMLTRELKKLISKYL